MRRHPGLPALLSILACLPLATGTRAQAAGDPALSSQPVAANQVGFETARPKRFTAPRAADGTPFVIRSLEDGRPVAQGEIRGGIGDFSDFRPGDGSGRFRIELPSAGGGVSPGDPFLVRANLYQEQFWQSAVDFLIDARSAVGTHASAFGGCPWRDGTYYDAILPALVLFYLADPERVDSMPRQIDWDADRRRVLAPDFPFNTKDPESGNFMARVRFYYDLEPPHPDAPDVVKLIHWGAGIYLADPATRDPSGDPLGRMIHPQTIEQIAYVVWAWPRLKRWLPESFHILCRDLCRDHWAASLAIGPEWDPSTYLRPEQIDDARPDQMNFHPFKGRHAPGHSIVPNLLMHEVALREGRPRSAAVHLEAAVRQAAWCIGNLDWNDPRTTKGHRMSEHRTIPNLVWLLERYPQHAPAGLREKITDWVEVAISRSENLWDLRRYDLEAHWSIPKLNDVGNLLSLPAIATAAGWVTEDPEKQRRLGQLATAAIDQVFGRNPRLAAAPALPGMGFPEVERGWPRHYKTDVCARLELCRGSISSAPGTEMFPFQPEGAYRHAEGWVNYGASWCISLAYLHFDRTGSRPSP